MLGARRGTEERQAVDVAAEKLKGLVEAACQRAVDSQLCQVGCLSRDNFGKIIPVTNLFPLDVILNA